MHPTMVSVLIIAIVILLPLAPAILLFKHLPSHGQVEGTFQGMAYKFGGAAAGYFALLFVIVWRTSSELAAQSEALKRIANAQEAALLVDRYETWTLHGQVLLDPEEQNHTPTDLRVRLVPPLVQILPGGGFEFDIPVKVRNGRRSFPTVLFEHDGYGGFPLCLGSEKACSFGLRYLDSDREEEGQIRLKSPVTLTRLKAYAGGQPAAPASSRPPLPVPGHLVPQ